MAIGNRRSPTPIQLTAAHKLVAIPEALDTIMTETARTGSDVRGQSVGQRDASVMEQKPSRRLRNCTWLKMAAAVALVAFAVVVISLTTRSQPRMLNAGGFSQIRGGMTQEQVESILGGPPGDYRANPGGEQWVAAHGYVPQPGSIQQVWVDENDRIEIYFNRQNRVVSTYRPGVSPIELDGYERLSPPPLWMRVLHYFGFSRG